MTLSEYRLIFVNLIHQLSNGTLLEKVDEQICGWVLLRLIHCYYKHYNSVHLSNIVPIAKQHIIVPACNAFCYIILF